MTESLAQLPAVPACVGTDGDVWFSTYRAEVEWCQRICAGCPLRAACLTAAMARDEQYGVWGGQLFTRRWVSGSVPSDSEAGGWLVVGRDGRGLLVFAWRPTPEEAEQHLAALLEDGRRRGRLVAQARAAERRGSSLRALKHPVSASDLGVAA